MHEQPTSRWMPADAWIRAAEAHLEREPRTVATAMARLDRDQGPASGGRDRRWFEDAADLAWRVGVRPAARQLGVAHSTLLSGWKRHGVGRPTGPRNQHTVGS
jgi:hypothetical protein